ncbi:enoyl-CoA hydratase-related protein [Gordonia sp. LSe1-13]|uniref:Enoyl-CoA hydratase-related protein n=1 Tax=Gordonia sesuvii TaxID=3116777 RepID=A0ABU7M908_9ACTN|nr:enoyl-CoA hydratase-related protein [Gordonia sp. LSe1-13]
MSVLVDQHSAVLTVTLNRPDRHNTLDGAAMGALGRVFTEAEFDDGVAAIVLTAAGEKSFCAGMDLRAFAERGTTPRQQDGPGLDVLLSRDYPKPVVAAVNGRALGVGFELVLASDLVVAADHATFALPEVRRGLVAAGGGITRLPTRIPMAIALEMGLTGASIDAARAFELGLVNRITPGPAAISEAERLAAAVAANAPLAVRFTKKYMRRSGAADTLHSDIDRTELENLLTSEDAHEGATAFAERRPPVWSGR